MEVLLFLDTTNLTSIRNSHLDYAYKLEKNLVSRNFKIHYFEWNETCRQKNHSVILNLMTNPLRVLDLLDLRL